MDQLSIMTKRLIGCQLWVLLQSDHDEFRNLKNCNVLIRAHGEPPETYTIAEKNNITIIEATCPIVKKLQSRIKDTWLRTQGGKWAGCNLW